MKLSRGLVYAGVLVVPFFFLISAVKVMILPWFPAFEYSRAGFPDDSYGFTREERLQFAGESISYLLNDEPLAWLAELKMADGTPLYNERELSHMLDVKLVVQQAYRAWWLMLILLLGASFWFVLKKHYAMLAALWQLGSGLTLVLMALVLLSVLLTFNQLFTKFHELFFTSGTWTFNYSESLIRLFPLTFWSDAFIGVSVFTALFAVLAMLVAKRLPR